MSVVLLCLIAFNTPSIRLASGSLELRPECSMAASGTAIRGVGVMLLDGGAKFDSNSVNLLAVLAPNTFLVCVHGSADAFNVDSRIRWIGSLPARLKRSPALSEHVDFETVRILFSPCGDVKSWLDEVGLGVQTPVIETQSFTAVIAPALEVKAGMEQLLARPDVFWVEPVTPKRLLNDRSVWIGQSSLDGGQARPIHDHGIRGSGQVLAVMDTGLDADHCGFFDAAQGLPGASLNSLQRKVVAYLDLGGEGNWDSQGHGTHVAGSIAADASPYGTHNGVDGMAPDAKLVIQDGGYATDNFADLPFLPADYISGLFGPAYALGARIHSNSWGAHEDFGSNNYTAECQMTDQFMWDHPDFLILFAAGNGFHSGGPTVLDPATAKNVISVGATGGGTSANSMASFSSNGPVEDGRMKPDLVAPGASINSANNDFSATSMNCDQTVKSGTSMATPTTAGYAALVRQYFMDGFYPSGAAVAADTMTPTAALVKASLVASGTPLSAQAYPNNVQGFGRVTLDRVLAFDDDDRGLWVVDHAGLNQGEAFEQALRVADDTALTLVLVWTDYPSTPLAATNLVNNLDLTLTGPAGTYRGNVWSNGYSVTGGTADSTNNVEMIRLADLASNAYVVRVEASSIAQGPQPFAVVVTSDTGFGCLRSEDLWPDWPGISVPELVSTMTSCP